MVSYKTALIIIYVDKIGSLLCHNKWLHWKQESPAESLLYFRLRCSYLKTNSVTHLFFIELDTLTSKWPSGQQLKQQTTDSEQVPKIISCYNCYITVFLSATQFGTNSNLIVIRSQFTRAHRKFRLISQGYIVTLMTFSSICRFVPMKPLALMKQSLP